MKICAFILATATLLLAQAPPAGPNTVVTKIDGKDVTVEDIRQMLSTAPPSVMQAFQKDPKYAIQQVFMMRHMASEGDKLKLGERSPLKEQLEMERENIIAQAMLNQERDGYTVTLEQIKDYYAKNQARYQQVKIKVILIKFKPGAPAAAAAVPTPQDVEAAAKAALAAVHDPASRPEAEARTLATDVVAKARGGSDFSKLVAEFSEDPTSKAADGDLGIVTSASTYSEDMKKVVFALKTGEVSDPLRQANGFYIIRIEEKSFQPVEELLDPISQQIRQNHLSEWLNGLSKRFEPSIENAEFFRRPGDFLAAPPPPK
jgi:peptidyl-prolyl cis-trans isomerase C